MKSPQAHYPSPLGRMQAQSMDIDAVKRSGWNEQHILVISESDKRLDPMERDLIRRLGNRLYGSTPSGGQNV